MNTMFEKEDREERQDSEITLGTGTLLAIFFGLVVVCGVFFGFGYSMGRRSSDTNAAAQTAPTMAAEDSPATSSAHPKPSAVQVLRAQEAAPATDNRSSRTVVVDQATPSNSASEVASTRNADTVQPA